jgi:hypothetical protein
VPTIRLEHLSEAEKRAYILADNKLAEKAGWDREILAIELQNLIEMETEFSITATGFEIAEIDALIKVLDEDEALETEEPSLLDKLVTSNCPLCGSDHTWLKCDARFVEADREKEDQ